MKLRVQLMAFVGMCAGVIGLRAQTTFTWSQTPATLQFEDAANWQGGVAPTAGGALVFGPTIGSALKVNASIDVASLAFQTESTGLTYGFSSPTSSVLGVGSGGITLPNTSTGFVGFHTDLGLKLTANQVWNVGGNDWTLEVLGNISGAFGLTKSGAGTLRLGGANTFSGGLVINRGSVQVLTAGTLGANTGNVVINASGGAGTWASLELGGTQQTIGALTFGGAGGSANASNSLGIGSGGRLTLGGDVTVDASSRPGPAYIYGGTLVLEGNRRFQVMDSASTWDADLAISSRIEGTGALNKTGAGTLQLDGSNAYTGGTIINAGTLQMAADGALPAAGNLTVNATGREAVLEMGATNQTVGSLVFGGIGGSAGALNRVSMQGGSLTLGTRAVGATPGVDGGIVVNASTGPAGAVIEGGTLVLGSVVPQFNVGDSTNAFADLVIHSAITGSTGFAKTGAGTLVVTGQNTFTFGVNHNAGTLLVGSNTMGVPGAIVSGPLGTGTLTLGSGTTFGGTQAFGAMSDQVELANRVLLPASVTFGTNATNAGSSLRFTGSVLANDAAITAQLAPDQDVVFSGVLGTTEMPATFTFASTSATDPGFAILTGTTGSSVTRVTADRAAVVIASSGAAPSTLALGAINNGYLSVGATGTGTVPSAAAVLGRITDKTGFLGTFGFDTDFDSRPTPHVFSENLDLTGFGSNLSLGSASMAAISGTITPGTGGYRFGGGGGVLVVRSNLNGTSGVTVDSTARRTLAAVLQGTNTFAGGVSVTNSAAILNSPGALPAGTNITLGAHGYIGITEAATGVPTLAALSQRVTSATSTSILGLDSQSYLSSLPDSAGEIYSPARFVTETVDLSSRTSGYLGTATHAILLGTVIAPARNTLSLIAVSRGLLEVRSGLFAGNVSSVVVGSTTTPFEAGTVVLSGYSTYGGGTTLNSGKLLLSGSNSTTAGGGIYAGPLGTGALNVSAATNAPVLSSLDWAHIDNPITLGGVLQIGDVSSSESAYEWLGLDGIISGSGSLLIRGHTQLGGANTFTGGVRLENGSVWLGQNSALGTGDLTVAPMAHGFNNYAYAQLSAQGGARTINNRVILEAAPSNLDSTLYFWSDSSLTLAGPLVLNGPVRLAPGKHPVYLSGAISGAAPLLSGWSGPLIVTGTANSYTGGTVSDFGPVIFNTAAGIPASGLLMSRYDGYIGIAGTTFATSLQANFIDRFAKPDTSGAIGFDTPVGAAVTNTFGGPVDLRGFHSEARLGSATQAILGGDITPQYNTYNFGGGGGVLQVNTVLADAGTTPRDVSVYSNGNVPLTVRLSGANTYTGGTEVGQSALVFGTGALPASGGLSAWSGGYIGTEDPAVAPQDFVNRFDSGMQGGIIGFDGGRQVGALSLARFGGVETLTDPRILLGTTSSATLTGTITLPALQTAYRFAGYKGGQLTVSAVLGGANSVEIGDASVAATFRSPTELAAALSAVTLGGANTYTGGTKLFGGALGLGDNSALGTGLLTVERMQNYFDVPPQLYAVGGARTIANNILLKSDLQVGGANPLALTGAIAAESSPGNAYRLVKTGSGTVTLAGSNTFAGGISIDQGTVAFTSLNAAGTGPLHLNGSGDTLRPQASFTENALVYGISDYTGLGTISIAAGRTLTVNQATSSSFHGQFTSSGGTLVFSGPAGSSPRTLYLDGASSGFTGATKIQAGVDVHVAGNQALGVATNPVTLEGGQLTLSSSATLTNPLTVNSGVLAGWGTFQPGGTVAIKAGVALSPGGSYYSGGTLTFAGTNLTLDNGGVYQWQLPETATGGVDLVNVTGTVAINASTAPFTFKIIPAGSLELVALSTLFNPYLPYSWTVLNASAITVAGALANAFTFDTTHVSSLVAGGVFSISLNPASTSLILNFTPVPEPSTYALLGIGAAVLVFAHRRRRR